MLLSDLLKCPKCLSNLYKKDNILTCENYHKYLISKNIPLLYVNTENNIKFNEIIEREKLFYEEYPFPNYDSFDDPHSLIAKAERSIFAKKLNLELPFGINILEAGCGTGQLTNYLATSHRFVIGTDMSISSLNLGNKFKMQHNIERSNFVQMNLFQPCFSDDSFHVVISNGVLHHTPSPFAGFQRLVKLLKKGGYIIIGLYNTFGRIATHFRRQLFKLTNDNFQFLDPHLRRKDVGELKKKMWLMDQYHNPHESSHTFDEVLNWFKQTGIDFVSSLPRIDYDSNFLHSELFKKNHKGTKLSRYITQMKIALKSSNEGGFFIMIGQKN